jgi:hypothetical protein
MHVTHRHQMSLNPLTALVTYVAQWEPKAKLFS